MSLANTTCRYFNGYKPCGKNSKCDQYCPHKQIPSQYILIVHLGAIGAVVRSTSLLKAIKRKFPNSHITWVTDKPSHVLLQNHPMIDRVLTSSQEDLLVLANLEFDFTFCIDKSLKATAISKIPKVEHQYGFTSLKNGAIVPATPAAEELWQLGLDDEQKFFVNTKPETQLMIEALELGTFQRDDYFLHLNTAEQLEAQQRNTLWSNSGEKIIIGINTGCSAVIPYKKLSVETQTLLIAKILEDQRYQVVLLGGSEDTQRNHQIYNSFLHDHRVILSPTESGLRDGLISVQACDIVITGDSLGMHMAIAMKKWVIAWFGPTCAHEIDLYGRGVKIVSTATCAPCWKRSCNKEVMCYDLVSVDRILAGVKSYPQVDDLSLSLAPKADL